jgi:hypothetical protein
MNPTDIATSSIRAPGTSRSFFASAKRTSSISIPYVSPLPASLRASVRSDTFMSVAENRAVG